MQIFGSRTMFGLVAFGVVAGCVALVLVGLFSAGTDLPAVPSEPAARPTSAPSRSSAPAVTVVAPAVPGPVAGLPATTLARITAMRTGDREGYRRLLSEHPGRAPNAGFAVRRAWGRWLAATAPGVQEQGLVLLTRAGLQHTLAAQALGAAACGISGPDFVVCSP